MQRARCLRAARGVPRRRELDRQAQPRAPGSQVLAGRLSRGWGASGSLASLRSIPTSRRISVSASRPIRSIVASTSRGGTALALEHPSFGSSLQCDHRNVVRDRVVQLSRDPPTLLHHRLARGDVALALGELRAMLAVTDNTADETAPQRGWPRGITRSAGPLREAERPRLWSRSRSPRSRARIVSAETTLQAHTSRTSTPPNSSPATVAATRRPPPPSATPRRSPPPRDKDA